MIMKNKESNCSESEKNIYYFIKEQLKHNKLSLVISTIIIIFRSCLLLLPPVVTAAIVDKAFANRDIHLLWQYCIIYICIPIVSGISIFLDKKLCRVYLKIGCEFRHKMFEGFIYQPYLNLKENDMGRTAYLMCQKINELSSAAFSGIENFIWCLTTVVVGICLAFYYNLYLTILLLLCVLVSICLIKRQNKRVEKITKEKNAINVNVSNFIRNSIQGIRQIKVSGVEETYQKEYETLLKKRTQINFKNAKLMLIPFAINSLSDTLVNVGSYFIGALLIYSGQMTVGALTAFISIYNIIVAPIKMLSDTFLSVFSMKADIHELSDLYYEKPNYNPGYTLNDQTLELQVENVSFTYNNDNNVLENITMNMEDKQVIFIVGKSGGGKSTLCDMLLKLFPPTSGNIYVNKTKLERIDEQYYRNNVSYVSQDDAIFSGTVLENIMYQTNNVNPQYLKQVLKDACLYDWIQTLPDKENTYLENNGATLSGGERQRISIARALIRNPKVIIFDESFSAIDANTSSKIIKNIVKENKSRKLIFITHNLSLCQFADIIYVLKDGRIVEQGKFNELLDNKQTFYMLCSTQQDDLH